MNQYDILITVGADVSKGKQTGHTKMNTEHSLNKVWDIKSVLVKTVIQSYQSLW